MPLGLLYISFIAVVGGACPNGFVEYQASSRCFGLTSSSVSSTNAASACNSLSPGTKPASVSDTAISSWFRNNINHNDNELWIGLSDSATEGTFVWADGTSSGWHDWIDGKPGDDSSNSKKCVKQKPDGWEDDDCGVTIKAYCEFKKPSSTDPCPNGFTEMSNTDMCYKYLSSDKTYSASQTACTNAGGTGLAAIKSPEISTFLKNTFGNDDIWIGLRDNNNAFEFIWDDGTPLVGWPVWMSKLLGQNDGSKDCVYWDKDDNWKVESCSLSRKVICEFNGAAQTPSPTTTTQEATTTTQQPTTTTVAETTTAEATTVGVPVNGMAYLTSSKSSPCFSNTGFASYPTSPKLSDKDINTFEIIHEQFNNDLIFIGVYKNYRLPRVTIVSDGTCSPAANINVLIYSGCTGGSLCFSDLCIPQVAKPVTSQSGLFKCNYFCENQSLFVHHIVLQVHRPFTKLFEVEVKY